MKRLKALIKMELPSAVVIGLYFLVINFISFALIQDNMNYVDNSIKSMGMRGFIESVRYRSFMSQVSDILIFTTVMYGIGLCILVLVSFAKDKQYETGRFLKALPYTVRERNKVKIGVGLFVYLVNFGVLTVGILVLRAISMNRLNDFYEVTMLGELSGQSNSIDNLIRIFIVFFVICIGMYLFLIMMQYLINFNIGSVISSIFIILSPLFITYSLLIYGNFIPHTYMRVISFITMIYEGPRYSHWINGNGNVHLAHYEIMGDITIYLMVWGVLILVSILGIHKFSRNNIVEKNDQFISYKWFRYIYLIGVALCGGLLFSDLYAIFLDRRNLFIVGIVQIIGSILSFLIAYKIVHIGAIRNKKVVKA